MARAQWILSNVVLVAAFYGAAFLVDWRASVQFVFQYLACGIFYLPGAYIAWKGRQADTRMLTWSEPPPEPLPAAGFPGLGFWLMPALSIGGGFVAGWLTRSLSVYMYVAGGIFLVVGFGLGIAGRLQRRRGMTV